MSLCCGTFLLPAQHLGNSLNKQSSLLKIQDLAFDSDLLNHTSFTVQVTRCGRVTLEAVSCRVSHED